MLSYKFKNTEQLVNFITKTPEFLTWETVICRFSATNGLNIDMNTTIIDTLGKSSFVEFQFLLPTINNFYNTVTSSNNAEINVEVKLALPKVFKNKYDPNNEYKGFYLNMHGDNLISSASTSHLERTRDSGLQPITNWEEYVAGIYYSYSEKNKSR